MPLTGEYEPGPDGRSRRQAELYEASGGTAANTLFGKPIIVVTMVGARSGKLRKVPLMRIEHDGEYVLVASVGGEPKDPLWVHNLKANPHVEVQDGPVRKDYQARELAGDERAIWWERAVAAYPPYVEYHTRTDRQSPVFVLTPMDEQGA